jgi:hypothetical protein
MGAVMAEIRQVLSEKGANCCNVLGSLPEFCGLSVIWETIGPKAHPDAPKAQ